VAYVGSIRFAEKHDAFWGAGSDYQSRNLINPTWLDLAIIANAQIRTTGDQQHIFLEGFEVIKMQGEVALGLLWLGS